VGSVRGVVAGDGATSGAGEDCIIGAEDDGVSVGAGSCPRPVATAKSKAAKSPRNVFMRMRAGTIPDIPRLAIRQPAQFLAENRAVSATFAPGPGITVVDHPLVGVKLSALRDEKTASADFRRILRELGALIAMEASRNFLTESRHVKTPLAECDGCALTRPIILAPILRAGLGMADGMLEVLSDVSVGHIGMYRNEETLRPESYYFKLPAHLASAEVIVVDPMLATGWSAAAAIDQLKHHGAKFIRYVCLVSSPQGLEHLRTAHPDVPIFTAAVDEGLNELGYIVPGLGDAGDRYFGTFSRVTRSEAPGDQPTRE
jgi:uracil phosphoribosyltransferase